MDAINGHVYIIIMNGQGEWKTATNIRALGRIIMRLANLSLAACFGLFENLVLVAVNFYRAVVTSPMQTYERNVRGIPLIYAVSSARENAIGVLSWVKRNEWASNCKHCEWKIAHTAEIKISLTQDRIVLQCVVEPLGRGTDQCGSWKYVVCSQG